MSWQPGCSGKSPPTSWSGPSNRDRFREGVSTSRTPVTIPRRVSPSTGFGRWARSTGGSISVAGSRGWLRSSRNPGGEASLETPADPVGFVGSAGPGITNAARLLLPVGGSAVVHDLSAEIVARLRPSGTRLGAAYRVIRHPGLAPTHPAVAAADEHTARFRCGTGPAHPLRRLERGPSGSCPLRSAISSSGRCSAGPCWMRSRWPTRPGASWAVSRSGSKGTPPIRPSERRSSEPRSSERRPPAGIDRREAVEIAASTPRPQRTPDGNITPCRQGPRLGTPASRPAPASRGVRSAGLRPASTPRGGRNRSLHPPTAGHRMGTSRPVDGTTAWNAGFSRHPLGGEPSGIGQPTLLTPHPVREPRSPSPSAPIQFIESSDADPSHWIRWRVPVPPTGR